LHGIQPRFETVTIMSVIFFHHQWFALLKGSSKYTQKVIASAMAFRAHQFTALCKKLPDPATTASHQRLIFDLSSHLRSRYDEDRTYDGENLIY
jgi:hypothetical protein